MPSGTTGPTPGDSAAVLPQAAGDSARPILVPTPEGDSIPLRDPTRLVGTGDDTLELRTRTAAEKEQRRFKKNLILWTLGFLLLGITVIILMILGPL